MARRNRRRVEDARPLSAGYSSRRREGDFIVQSVPGSQATKRYVCPGCNQHIAVGVAHLVAWSDLDGPDGRRHWHTPCFARLRHSM
jgi:hypothetical protein